MGVFQFGKRGYESFSDWRDGCWRLQEVTKAGWRGCRRIRPQMQHICTLAHLQRGQGTRTPSHSRRLSVVGKRAAKIGEWRDSPQDSQDKQQLFHRITNFHTIRDVRKSSHYSPRQGAYFGLELFERSLWKIQLFKGVMQVSLMDTATSKIGFS